MSDTITAEATTSIASELGKAVVRASVQTALEMTAAVALLAAGGFVANKVQERRAKKLHAVKAEQ
jgi:hypothetical protein